MTDWIHLDVGPIGQPRMRATKRSAKRPCRCRVLVYEPEPAAKWKRDVMALLRPLAPAPAGVPTGPMALDVVAVVPRRKKSGKGPGPAAATGKPDLDNILKITMDAMSEFWADDAQVVEIHAVKIEHAIGDRPRLSLRARPLMGTP